jgi:hypothetical protein
LQAVIASAEAKPASHLSTGCAFWAKLFAKYLQLISVLVNMLIIEGSDETDIAGRTIHLLNEPQPV